MNITDPWVLPKGLVITPVSDLPPRVREQVDARDDDFAISRPQSRTPSRILDSQSAALLREFETPKTIGQAIARYSRAVNSDPEQTLEAALPLLTQMIGWRMLVAPDSTDAEDIQPSLPNGATAVDGQVIQCLQALEDSEIYQVRRPDGTTAALKILRTGSAAGSYKMLDREAAILRHVSGTVSPSLIDEGVWDGRRFLLLEWCEGVDAATASASLLGDRSVEAQARLLGVCRNILRAYAMLHAQGVTHSDIHPRNILVDQDDRVRIVDFGLARQKHLASESDEPPRGGIGFFFEPEYARSVKTGHQPPAATPLGEQYGLAALLYFLLTGSQYVDFSLAKNEMMRQIVEDSPVPFAQRGMASWPDVESALARALNKDASARFASVADFAAAFGVARVPDGGWLLAVADADAGTLNQLMDRVLTRVGLSGGLVNAGFQNAPKASLTYGAAGVAYALYRMATRRQDPATLSLADLWCSRAMADPGNQDSYYNRAIEITPEIIGPISPYHTLSGIHAVRALVSHALCDVRTRTDALESFITTSQQPCDNPDLALGRSGTLLVASLLLDTLGENDQLDPTPLREFGNRTMDTLWQEIDAQPPIQESQAITYLGIAHGWAGILYAMLNWQRASGYALSPRIQERLHQLIACAEPAGRGIRWPWALPQGRQGGPAIHMPGWCNGSAGHIFLWTAAHKLFGDDVYLQTAEKAGWNTWESTDSISNLCCGLAGQAYGLLNLYKHTSDTIWLDRARDLASRAAAWDPHRYTAMKLPVDSLYKGEMGIALLASDLSDPMSACMPFFEPEGWPA
jgi:serine/threonine-protein kinase